MKQYNTSLRSILQEILYKYVHEFYMKKTFCSFQAILPSFDFRFTEKRK